MAKPKGIKELENSKTAHEQIVRDVQRELASVRDEIARVKAERGRIESLAAPISVPTKVVHEKIDRAVADFRYRGLIPEASENGLLYTIDTAAGHRYLKPETLIGFLALLLGEETIKSKIAEAIKRTWPRETMDDFERARNIADLDRRIFEIEVKEEEIIRAIEKFGGRIARRGDLSPSVFLEFSADKTGADSQPTFDTKKLTWLSSITDESYAVTQEIKRLRENALSQRLALETSINQLGEGEPRRRLERQLEKVKLEIKDLSKRYNEHGETIIAWLQLSQNCHDFLFSHGLDHEGKSMRRELIFEREEILNKKPG